MTFEACQTRAHWPKSPSPLVVPMHLSDHNKKTQWKRFPYLQYQKKLLMRYYLKPVNERKCIVVYYTKFKR